MTVKELAITGSSGIVAGRTGRISRRFQSFDLDEWDRQIADDVAADKLDKFAEEAVTDYRAGRANSCEALRQLQILVCLRCVAAQIWALADKNFELLEGNPGTPGVQLKKVGRYWSARVGLKSSRTGS